MILHQSSLELILTVSGVLLLDQILGDDTLDQVVNFMTEGWILDLVSVEHWLMK